MLNKVLGRLPWLNVEQGVRALAMNLSELFASLQILDIDAAVKVN